MTIWQFMGDHPFLTGILAYLAYASCASIAVGIGMGLSGRRK